MNARILAALSISVTAVLPQWSCQTSGGSASETQSRAMASLPDATKSQVNGYLGALGGLTSILANVTDSASASAAMPRLEEYLDKVSQHARDINGLAPEARRRVSDAFGPQFSSQNDAYASQVNRIKGTPGLGIKLGALLDKVALLK